MPDIQNESRRSFIQHSMILGLGSPLIINKASGDSVVTTPPSLYLLGPQEGYSPHVGSLLSMMTMMREWVTYTVRDLTVEQLDYQLDDQSNSIGAMLLHLAATEKYYQLNTFDGMEWGSWNDKIKNEWDVPMNLGEVARDQIVGHNIDYYLSKLEEVREETKKGFASRDDDWLMKSEPFFGDQPTNNYAKWFHVCEHESNHNGQMKFLVKRIPD